VESVQSTSCVRHAVPFLALVRLTIEKRPRNNRGPVWPLFLARLWERGVARFFTRPRQPDVVGRVRAIQLTPALDSLWSHCHSRFFAKGEIAYTRASSASAVWVSIEMREGGPMRPEAIVRGALLVAAASLCVAANGGRAFATPITWQLTEFQPNINNGGRADTIAVDPSNNKIMVVASESGGLFKTKDGGANWNHVDSFTPYFTRSVVYVTSKIMLATTIDDYTTANSGGGIWRSKDGGASWEHIANPPAPSGVKARFAAGEISIAPDTGHIFVSTTFGVSESVDNGVNWTALSPFGSHGAHSVVAQSGSLVVAGNDSGVARSTSDGSSWSSVSSGPGAITDLHAFGRSPFAAGTLYAVNKSKALYVSEDSGASWVAIPSVPTQSNGCGGIAFVKPILSSKVDHGLHRLTLWEGDRCRLARLDAKQISGTQRFDYSGSWTESTMDHGDSRDLAFTTGSNPAPLLLGSDGGVHRTSDGGATWTLTGGGAHGYNALQVTEVKGQWIDELGQFDLYFGTQDNRVFSSGDLGSTWPNSVCCEGFYLEMLKHVHAAADSHVTFVSCAKCRNLVSGRLFTSLSGWPNPASKHGNPSIVAKSFQDQPVDSEDGFVKGKAATESLGSSWSQYATVPEDQKSIAKLSERTVTTSGKTSTLPVQYQPIRTGFDSAGDFDVVQLVRLSKNASSPTASTYYPTMTGFGGLGINTTAFAQYEVFAVDPLDSGHLIAPDIVNEKMMQSTDGGDTWSEIPALTSLVTNSGKYLFRSGTFSFPSAVSFSHDDPHSVALGTQENGLFVSSDGGGTWKQVPSSEKATYITSVEWETPSEAFVSTYGRGLWHLKGYVFVSHPPPICTPACLFQYVDMGDPGPDRFEQGIFVLDGEIVGAVAQAGVINQVYVSPGTSIGVVGFSGAVPPIAILPTAKSPGFQGLNMGAVASKQQGTKLLGIAMTKGRGLFGAMYGQHSIPLAAATGAPNRQARVEKAEVAQSSPSPTRSRPYLSISAASGSADEVLPGEPVTLKGERFPRGAEIEILVDHGSVAKRTVDGKGAFSMQITAPDTFGLHTVVVRDARTQKPIDGSSFIVRHSDEPQDQK
jgi:photosystem II stability/assembly factor-like uncharacterized protein